MAGRICEQMKKAIDIYTKHKHTLKPLTVAEAAARAGVTKRGLHYALKRAGVTL